MNAGRPVPTRRLALIAMTVVLAVACSESTEVSMDEADIQTIFESSGQGPAAVRGDIVCIDYRVFTPAREELLWGHDFCFKLGAGATISGFDEAIPGMRAGGRRTVKCPAHKHWGRKGYGEKIPPQTSLILEIKLTSIEDG